MRRVFVVVRPPSLDLDLRILQRGELALIQALLTEPTVETLYICVLDGVPRTNEVQFHAAAMGPFVHGPSARASSRDR